MQFNINIPGSLGGDGKDVSMVQNFHGINDVKTWIRDRMPLKRNWKLEWVVASRNKVWHCNVVNGRGSHVGTIIVTRGSNAPKNGEKAPVKAAQGRQRVSAPVRGEKPSDPAVRITVDSGNVLNVTLQPGARVVVNGVTILA